MPETSSVSSALSGSRRRPHSPPANQGLPRNSYRCPGSPQISRQQSAAMTNDSATSAEQRRPGSLAGALPSGSSARPNRAIRIAPNKGSAGTSQRKWRPVIWRGGSSPFQEVDLVRENGSPVPVQSNQQSQAHRDRKST